MGKYSKLKEIGILAVEGCWVGMQKLSAKTFSGEHNRLGQASILAEADSPVLFSRVLKFKGFSFPEKTKYFVFSGFAFWPLPSFKKKKQKMLVVGTPGFQDRVQIPAASLLDFYFCLSVFLLFIQMKLGEVEVASNYTIPLD